MALVSRMVSDITGTEANQSDFIQLVVKQHPAIDGPRSLDVLPAEVSGIKEANNVVVCEIRNNGDSREVVLTHAEFKKLCPDEVVSQARGTRGRRPGFSPGSKKT